GRSVERLVGYLRGGFPFTARVTIADNGSSDGTWTVACTLAATFAEVRAVHLDLPGRGRVLHQIWSRRPAVDVDVGNSSRSVSVSLSHLIVLLCPLRADTRGA